MKPKIFIGSSAESVEIAYALQQSLEPQIEVTVWDQGIFEPSGYTLEDLSDKMNEFHFAAFVFSGDDLVKIRNKEQFTPRDNVIFELGLFIGTLGRKKCFIIIPRDNNELRIPTDLIGMTYLLFDSKREDKNILAALGPVSSTIKKTIANLFQSPEINKETVQKSVISSEGELLEGYRQMLQSSIMDIYFIINQRDWIFPLIISLTAARKRGLNINIAYYCSDIEKKSIRLKILNDIGCKIFLKNINDMPSFFGVISNPSSKDYSQLIIQPNSIVDESNVARKYSGSNEHNIIDMAYRSVQEIFEFPVKPAFVPEIVQVTLSDLINKVKNVPFYKNCSISLEKVEIEKVIPLTKFVREFKLNQISTLIEFYKELNINLFEPCAITTENSGVQLLVPPVLEQKDGKLYIAEGHSRLLYCKQNNINEVYALIVKGCTTPLASSPNKWENIKIAKTEAKTHAVYEGRKIELARRIETYTHLVND